jgi:energy-converting hydrogenase A subunit R
MKRIFVTDCEGPISKNDNAFELTAKLIPEGAELFTLLSKYDDVLADLVKKPGYMPGDTLKLILPFLKAFGATNKVLRELSTEGVVLVPGARETLSLVRRSMPSFIVSTSYEQYIQALCTLTDFPMANVYCTKLDLDQFEMPNSESDKLRSWANELAKLPLPTIPVGARSITDLGIQDQKTIRHLDDIFWSRIQKMTAGRIIRDVRPIGGPEKVEAVKDIVEKNLSEPAEVIYIGDSITDSAPLRYVKENQGLSISFNGNEYAIREAELAVLSENTLAMSILSVAFNNGGREAVKMLVSNWGYGSIREICGEQMYALSIEVFGSKLPQVEVVSKSNKERLTKESCLFRKKVRGVSVGSLG